MDTFISKVADFLNTLDDLIWGPPLLILLMGVGLVLTTSLRFLQIRRLPLALKYIIKLPPYQGSSRTEGEISSFAALCTALGATIGTGNIVGVATAVSLGGPGALFWMFLAAFFGMATKYAECLLAVKYREPKGDGSYVGGPMFYIRNGIGPKHARTAKFLAVMFAVSGILAGCLGIGTYTQLNSIVDATAQFNCPKIYSAIAISVILALIIIHGEECGSVGIQPEEPAARIIQCQVDEDADPGIVLHTGLDAELLIDISCVPLTVAVICALRIISGRHDNNIDIFLLFKFIRQRPKFFFLIIREYLRIICDTDALGRSHIHENKSGDREDHDTQKAYDHQTGECRELAPDAFFSFFQIFSAHPTKPPMMIPAINRVMTAVMARTTKNRTNLFRRLTGGIPVTSPVCPFMQKSYDFP